MILATDTLQTKLWTAGLGLNGLLSFIAFVVSWSKAYDRTGEALPSNYYEILWVAVLALALSITAVVWFLAAVAKTDGTSRQDWYNWYVPAPNFVRASFSAIVVFSTASVFVSLLISSYDQAAGAVALLWFLPAARLALTEWSVRKELQWTNFRSTRSSIDEKVADPCCGKRKWAKGCSGCWFFFVVVFVMSFAFTSISIAHDWLAHPAIGNFYTVQLDTGASIKLHIYCTGTRASSSDPIYIMQHGGGAFGLSMLSIQENLAKVGKRSCAYDRSSSGWSPQGPLPATNNQVVNSWKLLLEAAGEAGPYIPVGHSAGVELSLHFAAFFPDKVAGLVLIDGYPEYRYLIYNVTGAPTISVTENIKRTDGFVVGILDACRALTPVGWTRLILGNSDGFKPADKANTFTALYRSPRAWNGQYIEYTAGINAELSNSSQSSLYRSNVSMLLGGQWVTGEHWIQTYNQPLGSMPVLVIPAGETVGRYDANTTVTCDEAGKTNDCKNTKYQWDAYFLQSQSYATTLTSNGTLAVCPYPCSHSLPWTRAEFIVEKIVNKFG